MARLGSNRSLERRLKALEVQLLSQQDRHPIETVELWENRGGKLRQIRSEDYWEMNKDRPENAGPIQVHVIKEYRDSKAAAANKKAPQPPVPLHPVPTPTPIEIAPQRPVQEATAPQEKVAHPTGSQEPLSWLNDASLVTDF